MKKNNNRWDFWSKEYEVSSVNSDINEDILIERLEYTSALLLNKF